ncbi:MAG: antibiotic biosynthesis monooxygenase [Dehalococcoidia bacterium]|nr:antibiotic biosynthesis monooxygenase [Dehalococcoidia bacterium]
MITVLTWMRAKPGMEPQLQEALERMVEAIAAQEPGVVRYSVHRARNAPGEFYLYEQYRDREAQRAHGETRHLAELRKELRRLTKGQREHTNLEVVAEAVHAIDEPVAAPLHAAPGFAAG